MVSCQTQTLQSADSNRLTPRHKDMVMERPKLAAAIFAGTMLLVQGDKNAMSLELYENVVPANTSDCLAKVTSLPMVMYEFKYDSVQGRRQLGSVGPGLEEVIPESVEVHGRSIYPSPVKGEPPLTLENTAVVDKTVIFMNNVGATQELARRTEQLWEQLDEILENDMRMDSAIDEIERRMVGEADAQLVERKRIVEAEAEEARLAVEMERVKAAEYRTTMEIEAEQQRQALEHQTLIAKRKMAAEAEAEKARKEELFRMQEESARRREALRLETERELRTRKMELEQEMDAAKLQMDIDRVQAEMQAKVDAEKENEDVAMRKIRAQGEEDRKRVQETINTVLKHTVSTAIRISADPRRAITITAWLLGLAFGYLMLREATSLLRQVVESYLGRPGLIRETSRVRALGATISTLQAYFEIVFPMNLSRRRRGRTSGGNGSRNGMSAREEVERTFHDVILAPDLKEQVLSLSVSTRNARKNGAPYRHLLLYGPPGTGKTMVAKRLAKCSGMDCAIMSGGDVGPLGKDAVTELHRLFRWAEKSPRGLLLFIDEAEAFLGKRCSPNMSEDTRNALNALLYNTGTASRRLMMVLATNRAEDLDEAVLDRMDDTLLFPIPDKRSRTRLLVQYFHKYCTSGSPERENGSEPRGRRSGLASWWRRTEREIMRVEKGVDDRLLAGLAAELCGFSGREVSKLMLAVQSCVFGSEDGVLTADMLKRVVAQKASEHGTKAEMRAGYDS